MAQQNPPQGHDRLSPDAQKLLEPDEQAYGRLVVVGPGSAAARPILSTMNAERLLTVPVVNREYAEALLAGLWLWHDWLDESHRISQAIDTPTGSWHAILQ